MTSGVHNWVFGQGETWVGEFSWLDASGAPIDLTGYTAKMQARVTAVSPDTIIDLSTEGGEIILGGVAGSVEFRVHSEVTKNIDSGCYKYDIALTSSGGTVSRVLEGDLRVTAAVTR